MSLSPEERLGNINRALELMTLEIGDNPMNLGFFEHDKTPYTEIYSTTWRDLEERGLVKDTGHRIYQITARGWLAGARYLGWTEKQQFRANMSRLSATLKDQLEGRDDDALVDIYQLQRESGLSTGFIYNAIKSRLLDEEFGIKGAWFAPDDENENCLIVPLNYGERPLTNGPR
jgi:hypothetical protein